MKLFSTKSLEVMREEFSLSHGLFFFSYFLCLGCRLEVAVLRISLPKMSSEKIVLPFIVLYWQPIKFSENILIQKSREGLWSEAVGSRGVAPGDKQV